MQQLGGTLLFVFTGWGELSRPAYGLLFSASYVVPLVLLVVSYGAADSALRLRLRWMLWGSVIWALGIFASNTPLPAVGPVVNNALDTGAYVIALVCFLYAVLRHRVVNISVAVNHTLVYGSVTAFVVGILALLNSVLEHAALGVGASLVLQILVPLLLGIMFEKARNYADKLVEQVFFRKRYLAERALRRFAHHSSGFENDRELLRETAVIVSQNTAAPDVAVYQSTDSLYRVAHQEGAPVYPGSAQIDDPALAAARAGQKSIDLAEMHSRLGSDGYVFALGARAVLMCANRPGERYSADERKLLAHVARQVGVALDGLQAQEAMKRLEAKAGLVDAVLAGTLSTPAEITAKARELGTLSAAG